ncbi:MAG TPA: alpha/beta hydrolase [Mycobacteriales bacterium]|nr:alpha/beta hydrolase [Mycobacteriales bacterium]
MSSVTLETGATIEYDDTGGDGPAVVLSHGLLMNRSMFEPQVEALRDAYRVISWDQRGHGPAEHEGRWSYWDSARDVLALLDHLGVQEAVLGGMSQGGFLSLRATLLEPARVRALVLIDSQAGPEDPEASPMYWQMAQEWSRSGSDPAVLEVVSSLILGPADHRPWIALWDQMPPHRAVQVVDTLLTREDVTDRLAEITCPALVLHGTADAAIPVDKGEELAKGLMHAAPIVLVEGAGHASNLSHPEVVNAAIRSFLDGLG